MKKIKELALIVAGIDEEYQNSVIEGIITCAKKLDINISCFSAFAGVISNNKYDLGEYNIYNLINLDKFDGVILMTNTISDIGQRSKIIKRVKASNLPAVVLDCADYPEFYNVSIDNRGAMKDIVRHVINDHGARVINFISGPLTNPEAVARYEAFLEVMAENRLVVDTRRIYFGEFRPVDGTNAIKHFKEWGLSVPDAIICANDATALAAIAELEKQGKHVPDDIIVTGFDNIYNASHNVPALTTVDRPLRELGFKACKAVVDLIDGKAEGSGIMLDAKAVYSESCGCKTELNEDIKKYKKESYKLINSCRTDISILNKTTTELAENETLEQNIETFAKLNENIEGEQFCLCLCDNWDGSLNTNRMQNENDYCQTGYTENMSAPLLMVKGRRYSVDLFSTADMYPVKPKGAGNISYFLPLHYRERCLGYYIITNSSFPTKSMLCHSLMLNISNSLENIRKLIHLNSAIQELDKLYVMDPLCNIYNRNGFIRAADAVFNRCRSENKKILISFIDMDGLKKINDNYGHEEGDFALQRLASIIDDSCKSGIICARFGGDEFIMLGSCSEDEDITAFEAGIKKRMKKMNEIIDKPYPIDASIGTIITEIDEETTLFALITKADALMYETKKKKNTSRYLRR